MDQQIIIKPTLNTNDLYDVIDTVLLKVNILMRLLLRYRELLKKMIICVLLLMEKILILKMN